MKRQTKWIVLLTTFALLLLASPAGAVNNFAADVNCVALYRFENGALTADTGPVGTNTLTNYNTVTADTVNYQEGAASASFAVATTEYFEITNETMSAKFPFKDGTSNTTITFCVWIKLASIPAFDEYYGILCKWGLLSEMNFHVRLQSDGEKMYLWGNYPAQDHDLIYIQPGAADEWTETTRLTTGVWYHIAVVIYGSGWRVRIYDEDGNQCLVASSTEATPHTGQPASLLIGKWVYYFPSERKYFDGLMDELVIFNDALTPTEIDRVREGTYEGGLEKLRNDWWWRRRHEG